MYAGDSFFSLSTGGTIGLAVLSGVLAFAVLCGAIRLMRGRGIVARLVIGAVVFAAFVWLSPQVYYAYYIFLFEDLPLQWVVRIPTAGIFFETISFTGRSTLSAHGKGALFWVLVIAAAMPRGLRR